MSSKRYILLAETFWGWWSGELRRLVPEAVVRRTRAVDPPQLKLPLQSTEVLPSELMDLAPYTHVDLILSDQSTMRRTLTLPTAAAAHLRQAIAFLIERLVPFAPDQVCYAVRVLSRDRTRRSLQVELVVVPRNIFDSAVELLARHRLLLGVIMDQEKSPAHVLDFDLRQQRVRRPFFRRTRLWKFVLATAVSISVLGPLLLWMELHQQAFTLRAEIAAQTTQAQQSSALRALVRAHLQEAEFVSRQHRLLSITEILNILSLVLPDETWLFGLEITIETVTLSGYTPDVPAILTRLQQIDGFGDTSLSAPVSRNSMNDRSRFELQIRLVSVNRSKSGRAAL